MIQTKQLAHDKAKEAAKATNVGSRQGEHELLQTILRIVKMEQDKEKTKNANELPEMQMNRIIRNRCDADLDWTTSCQFKNVT